MKRAAIILVGCLAAALAVAGGELLTDWYARQPAGGGGAGGGSLVFDGAGGHVSIPNSTAFYATPGVSNFTYEAWAKADSAISGWRGVLNAANGTSQGWYIHWLNDFPSSRYFCPGTCVGGQVPAHYPFHSGDWQNGSIDDGNWHHIAVVISGQGRYMQDYVDGVAVNNGGDCTQPLTPLTALSEILIGKMWPGAPAGTTWKGKITEVRLSKVARYSGNFTPATSWAVDGDTVAYYTFADGEGSTLTDASGNEHHGTLQGVCLNCGSWQSVFTMPPPTPDMWQDMVVYTECWYIDNLNATYTIQDGLGGNYNWTGAASGLVDAYQGFYTTMSLVPPRPTTGYSAVMEAAYDTWIAGVELEYSALPEWSSDHP